MQTALILLTAGIIASSLLATSANAQGRPDTRDMTCDQAKQLVRTNEGIVLSTGPRTYERYVSHVQYCQHNEVVRREWVPTKDNSKCQIGFRCIPRPRFND